MIFIKSLNIVIVGSAGQGVQTVESFLSNILKLKGYSIFTSSEYMSRVRGGLNSTTIRVSSNETNGLLRKANILFSLQKGGVKHCSNRIEKDTLIIGDAEDLRKTHRNIFVDFLKLSKEVGSTQYSNIILLGVILAILKIDAKFVEDYIIKHFLRKKKQDDVVKNNIKAFKIGYLQGESISDNFTVSSNSKEKFSSMYLMNGATSLALGAVAANCNFLSSYPMSPSTSTLLEVAKVADELGIVVEQAEDEISAINMSLGAWYSGARGLVTTSGGGFALMCEGMSLSGMIETPVVVSLSQRPGPATGLPTRTEQSDLNLALYAGHGDFSRVIFSPISVRDCFYCMQLAFDFADRFQVPVVVLSDQFLVDSYSEVEKLEILEVNNHFVKTTKDYLRYKFTSNGLSPRGIPQYGEGLVLVDSDEHDERGNITEDLVIREKMVNKRIKRKDLILKSVPSPLFEGDKDYDYLVVGFGSTYFNIREAIKRLNVKKVAHIQYSLVYPLHKSTLRYLRKAKKVVCVENNATGQFADLILRETKFDINERVLKYNGDMFYVEEIEDSLRKVFR